MFYGELNHIPFEVSLDLEYNSHNNKTYVLRVVQSGRKYNVFGYDITDDIMTEHNFVKYRSDLIRLVVDMDLHGVDLSDLQSFFRQAYSELSKPRVTE